MWQYFLSGVAALTIMTGAAFAQIKTTTETPVPTLPVFMPLGSSSQPAPTKQHGVDAIGNTVDTTTYYRTGPFGTYTDHTTTTTYPPGNPAAGTSITH